MKHFSVVLEDGRTEYVKAARYSVLSVPFGIVFYGDEAKTTICARFSPEKVFGIIGDIPLSGTNPVTLTEDSPLNTSKGEKPALV